MKKEEYKLLFDLDIVKALVAGNKSYGELAEEFGVGPLYIIDVAKRHGYTRLRGHGSPAYKLKQKTEKV